MSLRPCLTCGVPVTGSYCDDCRPSEDRTRERHPIRSNPAAWKALSKRVRRMQPWCLDCGAAEDLCADHVIPLAVAPELALVVENLTVRCRTCNGRRAEQFTADDAAGVVAALRRTYERRPSRTGRERIAVAERALAGVGGSPKAGGVPPRGKAQTAMNCGFTGVTPDSQNVISSAAESSCGTAALRGREGAGS